MAGRTEHDYRRFDQPDDSPAWLSWALRHRAPIAAALVAACWGVSSVLPMGWAT